MLKFEVYGVIRRGEPVGVVGVTRRQGRRALSSVIRILDSGFRVWGARLGGRGLEFWVSGCSQEFRAQGAVFRVYGLGVRIRGLGFRIRDLGFIVQGSGFRVQGSGFRVQGSGFRAWSSGLVVSNLGFRV